MTARPISDLTSTTLMPFGASTEVSLIQDAPM